MITILAALFALVFCARAEAAATHGHSTYGYAIGFLVCGTVVTFGIAKYVIHVFQWFARYPEVGAALWDLL